MAIEIEDLVAKANSLIQSYVSQLQTAYDNAFDSNTSDAVQGVCQNIAFKIAGNLARDGWIIRRTGVDVLNKNNAPDPTELKVLQNFITKQSAGKENAPLSWYKFSEIGNQSVFRYIRAYAMEQRCMNCHSGQQTKTGTTTALSAYSLTRIKTRNYFPGPVHQNQGNPLQIFEE